MAHHGEGRRCELPSQQLACMTEFSNDSTPLVASLESLESLSACSSITLDPALQPCKWDTTIVFDFLGEIASNDKLRNSLILIDPTTF
jgi:hypothetical protein